MLKKVLLVLVIMLGIVIFSKTISITYGEPWKELIQSAIKDFEKETGVKVDAMMIPYGVDLMQKLTTDLAAGAGSDIMMVDSYMIPAWAEAGYLYPLDNYVKKWKDWDYYYSGMKEIVEFDDEVYGIMLDSDVRMLWYSKEIFKKAGIAIPWEPKNWLDVLETALKIKEKVPSVDAPLFIPMGTKWGEGTTMQGFYMLLLGGDVEKDYRNRLRDWKDKKWIVNSPAIENALRFYRDVFVTYKLCPTDPHYVPDVWGKWRELMRNGDIGIGLGGSWEWREFWPSNRLPSVKEREKLVGWAPMPGINGKTVSVSGGWAIGINADTRFPDLAWKFLEILNSKERLVNWLVNAGKISPREDVVRDPRYLKDDYLKKAVSLMKYTSYRDTYPGYSMVSQFIQQATEEVSVDELSVTTAMENLRKKMINEFGLKKIKVIP